MNNKKNKKIETSDLNWPKPKHIATLPMNI